MLFDEQTRMIREADGMAEAALAEAAAEGDTHAGDLLATYRASCTATLDMEREAAGERLTMIDHGLAAVRAEIDDLCAPYALPKGDSGTWHDPGTNERAVQAWREKLAELQDVESSLKRSQSRVEKLESVLLSKSEGSRLFSVKGEMGRDERGMILLTQSMFLPEATW